MRVSEIRVNQIRVNQGLGVYFWFLLLASSQQHFEVCFHFQNIKGPAAKNDTIENPGCFYQILSFGPEKGPQ